MRIGIINYGLGNCRAIANMLDHIEIENYLLHTPGEVSKKYDVLILPGVGSFDNAVSKLKQTRFFDFIQENQNNYLIVGICLGMQLIFSKSEEGSLSGLEILKGNIRKLDENDRISIPNNGWKNVQNINGNFFPPNYRAYFNHKFVLPLNQTENSIGVLEKNPDIVVAIHKDNIFGFQFHPERSHNFGVHIFKSLSKFIN
jgi:glutamine amidotransferase